MDSCYWCAKALGSYGCHRGGCPPQPPKAAAEERPTVEFVTCRGCGHAVETVAACTYIHRDGRREDRLCPSCYRGRAEAGSL